MSNTIIHCLQAAAERFGPKPALITTEATLSFDELTDRSRRLASSLLAHGVEAGDRITLFAPNSWEWIVTYYGSLMAGAVVNPLNVMLTREEVTHAVQDCGASLLFGTREKIAPLGSLKAGGVVRDLVCFGDEAPEGTRAFSTMLQEGRTGFTPVAAGLDDTCTIGYTSGTTGHPKGAMHSHRSVLMNAQLTALMHGRREDDIVLTALPLPHVYGTVVMNSTLMTGGTLVTHSRFEEAAVLADIERQRPTLFEGVPTMYFFLLNHPGLDEINLSSLRMCTVGGQTMPVAKMEEVESRFRCPLVELWGMTELAGLGTTFAHTGPIRHGSIGVPLPYCSARIVDIADPARILPDGEVGELMFKGPLVMKGFYGNRAATRETIEPDGWMHTGDVARIDEEGFIYIVDRKKDVILTAGYNVYPAEIERVIAAHPDVAMVAVGAIVDEAKGELAKAYIVPKSGKQPEAGAILDFCRQYLAAYKVPRSVRFVGDLPKTSSGKVMRRKLTELDAE